MDDSTRSPSNPPLLGDAEPTELPPDRGPPSLEEADAAARKLLTFWPFVLNVLRRWRVDDRDVPDVAQELFLDVLLRAVRAGPSELHRPAGTWRAYLRVAAVRAAGHYRQREAVRGEHLGYEPGDDDNGEPSLDDVLLAREVLEKLDPAHSTSAERWRALHAFAVAGVPVSWIAEAEQVPAGTIRTRILFARHDLRAALRRRRLM